jgi:hypothetical protein
MASSASVAVLMAALGAGNEELVQELKAGRRACAVAAASASQPEELAR